MAELDECKLPKEFVSLQNTAGKFELISFPTNLRLISLQLSESSRTSSSASHTLSALLRGSGISQEHLKGEEGYCYFVFFPPSRTKMKLALPIVSAQGLRKLEMMVAASADD